MADSETKASTKMSASTISKYEYLNEYKDAIASDNIQVILFVGNPNSPARFEVQLNDVAQEIKSQFSA